MMKITVNNHELDVEEGDQIHVAEFPDELKEEWYTSTTQSRDGKVITVFSDV